MRPASVFAVGILVAALAAPASPAPQAEAAASGPASVRVAGIVLNKRDFVSFIDGKQKDIEVLGVFRRMTIIRQISAVGGQTGMRSPTSRSPWKPIEPWESPFLTELITGDWPPWPAS